MLKEAQQFKASKPTLPQALADDGLNLMLFGLGHGDIQSLKPWQSQGKASRARDLQESVDKSAPKLLLKWRQRQDHQLALSYYPHQPGSYTFFRSLPAFLEQLGACQYPLMPHFSPKEAKYVGLDQGVKSGLRRAKEEPRRG